MYKYMRKDDIVRTPTVDLIESRSRRGHGVPMTGMFVMLELRSRVMGPF